jgi:mannose/fructose-specific phosphotransferase system component IIA
MSKKILIATHSGLAEGFRKAMCFFAGEMDGVTTVCAYDGNEEDPNIAIDSFFDSVKADDTVVVFNDLLCGSINQILAKKLNAEEKKFHLITDVNLSAILGIATLSEEELTVENIRENIELAKANMRYMNDEMSKIDDRNTAESEDDFLS